MIEREAQNRKLAEWVEPDCDAWIEDTAPYMKSLKGAWWKGNGYGRQPMDFFTSEQASALIRERMCSIYPYVAVVYHSQFEVEFEFSGAMNNFAVTFPEVGNCEAWALAALKRIESECA